MKKINIFLSIFIIYLIVCIIISPNIYIHSVLDAISVWTFNVLPAILPFMLLTSLLMQLNFIEKISVPFSKPFSKLYRTSSHSGYVYILSILAGYPIGSKMIADLYERGKISRNNAFKMSSFCSNSGPMFIIGSVGVGMLLSKTAGYILFLSHILSALCNGLIYRRIKYEESYLPNQDKDANGVNFNDIICSSVQSVLSVAAIIIFFFVVSQSLSPLLNLIPDGLSSIIKGMIEMTQGCLSVSKEYNLFWSVPICSFLISFGGVSTIIQSITLLKKVNMPTQLFTLQKLTQAVISFIISLIFSIILF